MPGALADEPSRGSEPEWGPLPVCAPWGAPLEPPGLAHRRNNGAPGTPGPLRPQQAPCLSLPARAPIGPPSLRTPTRPTPPGARGGPRGGGAGQLAAPSPPEAPDSRRWGRGGSPAGWPSGRRRVPARRPHLVGEVLGRAHQVVLAHGGGSAAAGGSARSLARSARWRRRPRPLRPRQEVPGRPSPERPSVPGSGGCHVGPGLKGAAPPGPPRPRLKGAAPPLPAAPPAAARDSRSPAPPFALASRPRPPRRATPTRRVLAPPPSTPPRAPGPPSRRPRGPAHRARRRRLTPPPPRPAPALQPFRRLQAPPTTPHVGASRFSGPAHTLGAATPGHAAFRLPSRRCVTHFPALRPRPHAQPLASPSPRHAHLVQDHAHFASVYGHPVPPTSLKPPAHARPAHARPDVPRAPPTSPGRFFPPPPSRASCLAVPALAWLGSPLRAPWLGRLAPRGQRTGGEGSGGR